MAEKTKAELQQEIDFLLEENKSLHKTITKLIDGDEYIMIEISERNFIVAKKIIGHKVQFTSVATCRNRAQTERLVILLNKGEKE